MSEKETGKIYGLFPVTMINGVPDFNDCFINNHFMWMFEVMNSIEGLACALLDMDHYFIIKIDKKKDMSK